MLLGKPHSLKTYVPDRPGHDRRYLLNSSKIRRELGWVPEVAFDEAMQRTVAWYRENLESTVRTRYIASVQ
jgi:dTDP-glucose 4,6-dehydratase